MKQEVSIKVLLITVILSVVFIFVGNKFCQYSLGDSVIEEVLRAQVVEVLGETQEDFAGFSNRIISFTAKITSSGEYKGQVIEMTQNINEMLLPLPEEVEKGDKVLVTSDFLMGMEGETDNWYYSTHDNTSNIIILCALFLVLILIIGRLKGVSTIITLAITMGSIFFVYIPSILSGKSIYISTMVIAAFIILSTLICLNGLQKKTLCAIVGNFGGVILTGVLAVIVNDVFKITGVIDSSYIYLTLLETVELDLQAVIWGSVLIGSLGAVMDVSMSIASAMNELSKEMKRKDFVRMAKAGMNIGKDAIGTMTNTLVLAYVGSSLAVILLFTVYNRNLLVLMNLEMILVEIIQAVVGSMGILFAVPVTVLFSAWIFNKKSYLYDVEMEYADAIEKAKQADNNIE